MTLEQNPEDRKSPEGKRRYRTLGNLAIGLAFAGGLAAYGLLSSEDIGRSEILFHVPVALVAGAIVFFVLQIGRQDKSTN